MRNPITDIAELMRHYNFKEQDLTPQRFEFRNSLLSEEYTEYLEALKFNQPEEAVDALIDIVVISLGTLHLLGVNVDSAWAEVHRANMSKLKGTKPGRPSDGWDLYKPLNWVEPNHSGNTGKLQNIFNKGENNV
jgi:predicted HAD superfamily Cof-like phosphohydrolase